MASQHIISCELAVESTYGSIDADTGRPATTGLTWKGVEMSRDGLVYPGEPQLDMRDNETRSGPYMLPPEPSTMYNCSTGAAYQHLTGEIVLNLKLRSVGDGSTYANPRVMPWVQILNTAMSLDTASAPGTDAVGGVAVDVNNFTPTTVGSYSVGQIIAVTIGGQVEYSVVTNLGAALVTHSPAFSRALDNTTVPVTGDVVRFCDTLYTSNSFATGSSVALRIRTTEGEILCFGCRATNLAFSVVENQLVCAATLSSAHIEITHGVTTPADTDFADGHLPHLLGTYVTYSEDITTVMTAPYELDRTVAPVKRDSIAITTASTQAEKGYSGSLVATSDVEIVDYVTTAELTLQTPATALDRMLWDQEERAFVFGFGPCGAGEGMCIIIPAAHVTEDTSKREFADGNVQQKLMLRPGDNNGDNDTTGAANADFKIGMVTV